MGNGLAERVNQRAQVARRGGGEVEQRERPTLRKQIEDMHEQFAMAMPRGFEAQQLIRDAMTLLRQNPDLAECVPETVLGGLMTFAQLGLRPGVMGQGWLIPFKNWKKGNRLEAQIVIGYQGYVELVHRSGAVKKIVGRAVHQNDEFNVEFGLDEKLVHRPAGIGKERGPVVAYYAVLFFHDADPLFWVMTREEAIAWRDHHAMGTKRFKGEVVRDNDGNAQGAGPWFDMDGPDGGTGFDQMAIKGLALDTPLPTPSGWTTMGDVRVGDLVLDMHGQPTRVIVKSPVKHLGCYRVTFTNGQSIVCDEEHLWLARVKQGDGYADGYRRGPRGWETYEIGDLYAAKQRGEQVTMPVTDPVDLPDADLPLDPWVLGYWLGDGASANPSVTCNVGNVDEITAAIRSAGYEVGSVRPDPRSRAVTVYIKGIKKILADLGLLGHKHVPAAYLRGSARQRLALLRGLMDSDGGVDYRGRAYYGSTAKALTDAVCELARSLGEIVSRSEVTTSGYGRTALSYRAQWTPAHVPVTLQAKAERVRPRTFAPYRGVRSIERIDSVPTQCIGVDAPTHTYLAGEDWAPTHNTCFLRAKRWAPKSTDRLLTAATEVDGAVRLSYKPSGQDDYDEMLTARHPEPEPGRGAIAGAVIDAPTDDDTNALRDTDAAASVPEQREDDVPPPPEPPASSAAPADGGEPIARAMTTQIGRLIGAGGVADDAGRKLIASRLAGRTAPVGSTSELTRAEGVEVIRQLQAAKDGGRLQEFVAEVLGAPAAPAAEAPAGDLPTPGTRAWHDAGHPTRSDDGRVTTVPALMNGECGICEEPDPRDEEDFQG